MKKVLLLVAGCLFGSMLFAQQPLLKRVWVDLPHSVMVNDKTLEPGQYVFEEPRGASSGNLYLNIFQGEKEIAKVAAQTISVERTTASEDSALTLTHIGSGYYLDKLWVQGENIGYQFPLPSNVKDAEKERAESIRIPVSSHGK